VKNSASQVSSLGLTKETLAFLQLSGQFPWVVVVVVVLPFFYFSNTNRPSVYCKDSTEKCPRLFIRGFAITYEEVQRKKILFQRKKKNLKDIIKDQKLLDCQPNCQTGLN
jgi:hypothetical protein